MVTLAVCGVLGVILLGIIKLANNEGQMTGRSQNWNSALPIAEAGIEEAFTHLKHSPSNRAENGWSYDATATPPNYTRTRTFQDGYYTVTISTNWDPVIISRAGMRAPGQTNYSIFRKIRVQATNQPLWTAAIEALECVTLSGNGIKFDSYNSLDPLYSDPDGTYNPNKVKAGGDVACYGSGMQLDLGNADIAGSIKTGPDTTFTMGPNASVGDLTWGNGLQPGHYEQVENTDWPNLVAPVGNFPRPQPSNLPGETTYQFVLGDGIYSIDNVNGSILVKGKATLVVRQKLTLQSAVIRSNAQLIVYMDGSDATVNDLGNQSTDALHFMYFGSYNNVSVKMGGNSAFCGVVYAPAAFLLLNGGGKDAVDFSGAIIARCVKVTGHYSFHFDEAVRRYGSKGIIASRWDEISPDITSF